MEACETNHLLKVLNPSVWERFAKRFERIDLRRGDTVQDSSRRARLIFPSSGLIAILSETLAGESVQTGAVGCDGAVGAIEALGSEQFLARGVVQVSGSGWRVGASAYRDLLNACNVFRAACQRYVETQFVEARQIMACNALHTVESRLARSILEAIERSCLDRALPVTQEALSKMVGAQRTTVAMLLSKLQRVGLIRSGRGSIEVLDKAGLERTACSCRETLQFARSEIALSDASEHTSSPAKFSVVAGTRATDRHARRSAD